VVHEVPEGLAVVFQDYKQVAVPVAERARQRGAAAAQGRSRAALAQGNRPASARCGSGWPLWRTVTLAAVRRKAATAAIARAIGLRIRPAGHGRAFGSVYAQTREDLEDLVLGCRDRGITILLAPTTLTERLHRDRSSSSPAARAYPR